MERIAPSSFGEALRAAYVEVPCAVLPNPLWKTLACLDGMATRFTTLGGRVESVQMWAPGELHPYWHRAGVPPRLVPEEPGSLRFALVHHVYADSLRLSHLSRRSAYFRLRHNLASRVSVELPAGYWLREVELPSEAEEAARLIAACYSEKSPPPEAIRSWTTHPTFAPDLWLWAIAPDGRPAGLGIAELDRSVPEGALEWVQVLPAHRGLGLGTALVCELLQRLAVRAAFATVSGRIPNATRPEHLYRRCGFAGNDIWWVMRRG